MPDKTFRLSSRFRPGWSARRGTTGSSGSIRAHNSSGTIHGGCWPFLTALLNRHTITGIPTGHSVSSSKCTASVLWDALTEDLPVQRGYGRQAVLLLSAYTAWAGIA